MDKCSDYSDEVSRRWKQLYSSYLAQEHPEIQQKFTKPLQPKCLYPFGQVQNFKARQEAQYHVIKNSSYALKQGTPLIDEAEKLKSITLPIDSTFKGFPLDHVIAYIDLENLCLIWPKKTVQTKTRPHFLLLKKYQFCTGHSLLIFNIDKSEPQILTKELIFYLLKASSMIPQFTLGYNSQGAGSTLNIFHYQCLDHKDMTSGRPFHFQSLPGKQLTRIHLKSIDHQDVPVIISTFEFLGAIFIRIQCQTLPLSHPSIVKDVSTIIYSIVDVSLRLVVPHNINFPNQHSFYLILRSFATPLTRFGWIEYSGVFKTSNDQEFNSVTSEKIDEVYQKLSLTQEKKDNIYNELKKIHLS